MILASLLAIAVSSQSAAPVGRYDMGERLKELDRIWLATTDKSRKAQAVPKVTSATTAFIGKRYDEACRSLDEAIAALEGRPVRAADAITLRFDPPFVEPRMSARLKVSWSYVPTPPASVRVAVGDKTAVVAPGRDITLEVRPDQIVTELTMNPEAGVLVPVLVGPEQRTPYLSIIKKPMQRLTALRSSQNLEAKNIIEQLGTFMERPETMESDISVIQQLFTAELLDEGRLRLERADTLPFVRHKETTFRVAFPREVTRSTPAANPVNVVIAMHGAGGSENMFFDAYGNGLAVQEALKRGWVFVAPRATVNAPSDVIDWLRTRRKLRVGKVFLMGHSMGGGVLLGASGVSPSAIALFAPASDSIGVPFAKVPTFLAVGKQDTLQATQARLIAKENEARGDFQFTELDPCEHLMIVAEALPAAYRFFDSRK